MQQYPIKRGKEGKGRWKERLKFLIRIGWAEPPSPKRSRAESASTDCQADQVVSNAGSESYDESSGCEDTIPLFFFTTTYKTYKNN